MGSVQIGIKNNFVQGKEEMDILLHTMYFI